MKIIALFNLQPGTDESVYEEWAKSTDLPTVRSLGSIDGFDVLRTTGILGSEDAPPYRYIEIIDVNDMNAFGGELASGAMQKVAGEFQDFADSPVFILTEAI